MVILHRMKNHPVTREGVRNGVGHLERMKRGSGIKDRDDRSSGIEILMTDAFAKINPN
jgi:hypothetical protein